MKITELTSVCARTLDPELTDSIRKYGIENPIRIDYRGKIINGHSRYRSALALGYTDVPVTVENRILTLLRSQWKDSWLNMRGVDPATRTILTFCFLWLLALPGVFLGLFLCAHYDTIVVHDTRIISPAEDTAVRYWFNATRKKSQ